MDSRHGCAVPFRCPPDADPLTTSPEGWCQRTMTHEQEKLPEAQRRGQRCCSYCRCRLAGAGRRRRAVGDAAPLIGGATTPRSSPSSCVRPPRIDLTGLIRTTSIDVEQFSQQVLTGYPKTKLYGYGDTARRRPSWPGPTIVAMKNRTTRVLWRNNLPPGRGSVADAHLLRSTSRWRWRCRPARCPRQHPDRPAPARRARRVARATGTRRRGSRRPRRSAAATGASTSTSTRTPSAPRTLWYHDHAIGITRLNVYAGLAGAYLAA